MQFQNRNRNAGRSVLVPSELVAGDFFAPRVVSPGARSFSIDRVSRQSPSTRNSVEGDSVTAVIFAPCSRGGGSAVGSKYNHKDK